VAAVEKINGVLRKKLNKFLRSSVRYRLLVADGYNTLALATERQNGILSMRGIVKRASKDTGVVFPEYDQLFHMSLERKTDMAHLNATTYIPKFLGVAYPLITEPLVMNIADFWVGTPYQLLTRT
jgi:hypothetical protein